VRNTTRYDRPAHRVVAQGFKVALWPPQRASDPLHFSFDGVSQSLGDRRIARPSPQRGTTGRGKTHLAVAIGYRAIQLGFETRFTTAAQLIEDLSNASRHGRLHDALLRYTHPHVLIVDEVAIFRTDPTRRISCITSSMIAICESAR
jgi:IstB-like ATP binding protein